VACQGNGSHDSLGRRCVEVNTWVFIFCPAVLLIFMLDKNKKLTHIRTATLLLTRHKAREMHLIAQFKAKMPTFRALCAESRIEREICSFCRS
jgi:hypothetical protein